MSDPLFVAWADLADLPSPPEERVVWDRGEERAHVLSEHVRTLLAACRAPATLADHARRTTALLAADARRTTALLATPARHPAALLTDSAERAASPSAASSRADAELAVLAHRKLLVDATTLRGRIAPASLPPAQIAWIGIPTANRPAALTAAVRAHVAALARSGRRARIAIADSSPDPESRLFARGPSGAMAPGDSRNMEVAGIEVRCAGIAEREIYARALAEAAGVDLGVVRFALIGAPEFGVDTGANRNVLLLDGIGEAGVQVDDDVGATIGPPPDPIAEGARLVTGDPSAWWFPSEEMPENEGPGSDLIAAHERLLGRGVAEIAAEAAARGGLAWPAPHAAWCARAGRGGVVRATQTGASGDAGMGTLLPFLLAAGPSRARLLASEATYRRAAETRRVVRCAPQAAIADRAACMAFSLGIDAREMLPPFSPLGRDTDGWFGAALHALVPDAFLGFVPGVVAHRPPVARASSWEREIAAATRVDAHALARILLAATGEPSGRSVEIACAAAGAAFEVIGARPADAEALLAAEIARAYRFRVQQIEKVLAAHRGSPPYWARDLRAVQKKLADALAVGPPRWPADLVERFGPERAREVFLKGIRDLGALLSAWPALWSAAVRLAGAGVRLSVPVPAP